MDKHGSTGQNFFRRDSALLNETDPQSANSPSRLSKNDGEESPRTISKLKFINKKETRIDESTLTKKTQKVFKLSE